MIIGPKSEFHRTPECMNDRDAFYREGIHVSIAMIDLAYTRLQHVIAAKEKNDLAGKQTEEFLYTAMITDAWTVIDAFHRLQDVVKNMGFVSKKHRRPAFRNLLNKWQDVNVLRNTVQHLAGSIDDTSPKPATWQVWGVLTWSLLISPEIGVSGCFIPGRLKKGSYPPMRIPANNEIEHPAGPIWLHHGDRSVSLSELVIDVRGFAKEMEVIIAELRRSGGESLDGPDTQPAEPENKA